MPQKLEQKDSDISSSDKRWSIRNFQWKRGLPMLWVGLAVIALTLLGAALYPVVFVKSPDLPEPSLKELATARGVELGVLTQPKDLGSRQFKDVLKSQYSTLTTDGEMHWDTFRPTPDEYDWDDVDRLVKFASQNGMSVEGHHLIWDEVDSLPKWLKEGNHTRQQLRDIMRTHINAVAGRYKGKITEWSVVNEPFSRAQGVFGLDDWWGDKLGGDTQYIDDAFVWARQADPKATLILNDFYNETATSVANAQYDYIKAAKARGIPIDAVGMQMHIDAAYPPDKAAMVKNMQRFAELGTPVYITEFDVNSSKVKGDADYKAQLEAKVTADVVRACIESKNCASFTVFGMTDVAGIAKLHAFNRKRSYLLSSRYQPEAMFYGFRDAWLRP